MSCLMRVQVMYVSVLQTVALPSLKLLDRMIVPV